MLAELLMGTSSKSISSLVALFGTSTILAESIPVPEGWSTWPATAVCGFLCLAMIGLLCFKMKLDATVQKEAIQSNTSLAVAIKEANQLQIQTNTTLNCVAEALMERPCMLKKGD